MDEIKEVVLQWLAGDIDANSAMVKISQMIPFEVKEKSE